MTVPFFYVLLTVHLDVILINNQLDALFSNVFIYFNASTCFEQQVLIIRRANLYKYTVWYNTLIGDCLAGRPARQSPIRVLYQTVYLYKLALLMMSTCCSKHVEALK